MPLWHFPQFWTFYHHNNMLHFAGHVMWVNTWWQRKECHGLSAFKESYVSATFVFTIFCVGLFSKFVLKFHGWWHLKFMRNLLQQNSFVYESLEIWWIDASKRPVHFQAPILLISLFRKKFQMLQLRKHDLSKMLSLPDNLEFWSYIYPGSCCSTQILNFQWSVQSFCDGTKV